MMTQLSLSFKIYHSQIQMSVYLINAFACLLYMFKLGFFKRKSVFITTNDFMPEDTMRDKE